MIGGSNNKMRKEEVLDLSEKYLSRMYKRYYPFFPDRGIDDTVYDLDGASYIDLYAGVSIVNVGWHNKKVSDAIDAQLKRLYHTSSVYYLDYTAKLAKMLADLSPGGKLTKSFFTNSGSEANETAISVSRRTTRRQYIIALHRSFHGRTFYALSALGQSHLKSGLAPFAPVAFAPDPYCYRCPLGHKSAPDCGYACARYLDEMLKCAIGGDSVAAFLAEPMQANGGMIIPPPDYFKEIKAILDRHQILFIDDEVQAGNGRSGKLWGIEHYGVVPDILTVSKAIANGLPLGVTMMNESIDSLLKPGEHYSTLGGNAISCVAATAVLEQLRAGIIDNARESGKYFKDGLEELMDKYDIIGDVRGAGLFIGIELVKERSSKAPAREEAAKFLQESFKRRVLVGLGGLEGNVIRIEPPLVLTREHIDQSLEAFEESLKAIRS